MQAHEQRIQGYLRNHYVIYSFSGNLKMGHSDNLRQSHIKTISLFNGFSKVCC